MTYVHPIQYAGLKFNSPNNQKVMKAWVEANCLKCTKFCGREHSFDECTRPQDCPKPVTYVSLVEPDCCIKLPSL